MPYPDGTPTCSSCGHPYHQGHICSPGVTQIPVDYLPPMIPLTGSDSDQHHGNLLRVLDREFVRLRKRIDGIEHRLDHHINEGLGDIDNRLDTVMSRLKYLLDVLAED